MDDLNPWGAKPYLPQELLHDAKRWYDVDPEQVDGAIPRLFATIDAMICREDRSLDTLLAMEGIMRVTTAAKVSAAPARALRAMYEGGIPTASVGNKLLVVRVRDVVQWEAARVARVFDGRRPEVKAEIANAFRNADLSWLPERKRSMIEMRYGLNGNKIHTLESIAAKFDISRQRVHQVIQGVRDRLLIRLLQAQGEAKCEM